MFIDTREMYIYNKRLMIRVNSDLNGRWDIKFSIKKNTIKTITCKYVCVVISDF